jgi:hypothetical protein
VMSASVVAGQVTSRTGHYKVFPVVGSFALVAGMLMLWRLSADSSLVYASTGMLVVGAGLGLNMQTIVLAMQNAVPAKDIGVATSSATFFRQIGGTLGVAIFLSIVYSTVGQKIQSAYQSASGGAAFQAAAKAHPEQLSQLQNTSTKALNDTAFLNTDNSVLTHPFKVGFTTALTFAFLVAAVVLTVTLVLAIIQREVPLRTMGGRQAAAVEAAADLAAMSAPNGVNTAGRPSAPVGGPVEPRASRTTSRAES